MTEQEIARFWAKVDKSGDCWTWVGATFASGGYGCFSLNGKNERAHRLSYEIANGPILDGLVVCHRCDNPPCVRPDHLFLGTRGDNARDMSEKGRGKGKLMRGEDHPGHKLNEQDVMSIRSAFLAGAHKEDLARQHKVSGRLIYNIIHGEAWPSPDWVPIPTSLHRVTGDRICCNCGTSQRKNTKGRCPACYSFFHRHGRDKTKEEIRQ